ncbi:MAG: AbgT family transporter [Bacteroidales bacterium]|jgi:aminobenzoyl-glutamate transport protein|nr:AbgT family transporter [Bacteroidales bacterium]
MGKKKTSRGFMPALLAGVEKAGNALPHPAALFGLFALFALLISWIGYLLGWNVIHPATGETVFVENLLSKPGLDRIMTEMVTNFTDFAPLGIVLVAMLGIGIAESSGLISAIIRKLVLTSPKKILTFVIVLAGVLSNIASSVGYVLLVPLAGTIFLAMRRHPLVGMAAAFAGVSGGFSANLIIGTIDPLLAGLTTEAAHILDPNYYVNPTGNYFLMVASVFLIAFLGTVVTERIVAPYFGEYKGPEKPEPLEELDAKERKGLRWSLIVMVVWLVIFAIGLIPSNGFLRGENGGLLNSPVLEGVVAFLFLVAGTMGIAYGIGIGKFKKDADIIKGMADSMKTLAYYVVLVFFAAQFVAYFKWSNLGLIFAIEGADFLMKAELGLIPTMLLFIILSGMINMVMGSASAKWAIMAPIFVPVFMLLGYSPELSQVVYRIGDSVTNVISPMMSFFALIIAYFQKYEPKSGIGTVTSTMLPYSITFFIGWSLLLIAWVLLGLPLGPGAGIHYQLPV